MDYIAFRKEVIERGLLDRQYGYYTYKIIFTFAFLALSVFFLVKVDNFALQLLNAAFLAIVLVQVGLIMHDAEHQQIFNSSWKNSLIGLITGNLAINLSAGSWASEHNKHHSAPNNADIDPDVNISVLAYSEEQALAKNGLARFIARYQAFFWFPLLTLTAYSKRIRLLLVLLSNLKSKRWKYYIADFVFLVAGAVLYYGLVFYSLNFWKGTIFILVNQALAGLYVGTIFATNHKALPLVKGELDFLHAQVLTTRTVKSNPLINL